MKYHIILTILNLLTVYFATVNHELNALGKGTQVMPPIIGPCSYIVTIYYTVNVIHLKVSAF